MMYLHRVHILLNKAPMKVEVIADINATEQQLAEYVFLDLRRKNKKLTREEIKFKSSELVKRLGI